MFAINGSLGSLAGDGTEFSRGRDLDLPFFGATHDRFGKGMFAERFDGGDVLQQAFLGPVARWSHEDEFRLAFGQRARLVDNHGIDLFEYFERCGIFDQNTILGTLTRPHHDGHRRRQAERARTGNYQNRHRINESEGQGRFRSPDGPYGECDYRRRNDCRYEPA